MHDRYALSLKYLNDVPSDIISDLRDESALQTNVFARARARARLTSQRCKFVYIMRTVLAQN